MTDDEQPSSVCANLIGNMRSLLLSTVGEGGVPHCGYAPYLYREPCYFYIFVSQLAMHTRNLLKNKTVAVMIMEDENSTAQIFARVRVHYLCEANPIASDSPDYVLVLDDFQKRHGKMVGLLRQLPDFVLFQLRPVSGQFVMGFGKAYALTGDNLTVFEHSRIG